MKTFLTAATVLMMLTSAGIAMAENNNNNNANNGAAASADAQKTGSMAAESETGRTKDCQDASMTDEMKAQCSAAAEQGTGVGMEGADATGSTVPLEGENSDKKTDSKPAN